MKKLIHDYVIGVKHFNYVEVVIRQNRKQRKEKLSSY